MIREKVMKLLRLRVASLGINWTKRFLDRYSDYRPRFPRHLDQERHWNTDRKCSRIGSPLFEEQWTSMALRQVMFITWMKRDGSCGKYSVSDHIFS